MLQKGFSRRSLCHVQIQTQTYHFFAHFGATLDAALQHHSFRGNSFFEGLETLVLVSPAGKMPCQHEIEAKTGAPDIAARRMRLTPTNFRRCIFLRASIRQGASFQQTPSTVEVNKPKIHQVLTHEYIFALDVSMNNLTVVQVINGQSQLLK